MQALLLSLIQDPFVIVGVVICLVLLGELHQKRTLRREAWKRLQAQHLRAINVRHHTEPDVVPGRLSQAFPGFADTIPVTRDNQPL